MSSAELSTVDKKLRTSEVMKFVADTVDDAHLVATLEFGAGSYNLVSLGGTDWVASGIESVPTDERIRSLVQQAVSLAEDSNIQDTARRILRAAQYQLEDPKTKATRLDRENGISHWRDLTRE